MVTRGGEAGGRTEPGIRGCTRASGTHSASSASACGRNRPGSGFAPEATAAPTSGPSATPPAEQASVSLAARVGRSGSRSPRAAPAAPVDRPTATPWTARPAASCQNEPAVANTTSPAADSATAGRIMARRPRWSDQWPTAASTGTRAKT